MEEISLPEQIRANLERIDIPVEKVENVIRSADIHTSLSKWKR